MPPPELKILFPNGQVLAVQMYIDTTTGPQPWDGTVPISPPVGGATSANQLTEIASLASIDSKLTNPLPVSGTIAITGPVSVTGGLTDTELRAAPIAVTGTLSIGTIGTIAVTGPLTDVQLRATPVPISGSINSTVTGVITSITNPVAITNANLDSPLSTKASAANQATEIASLASIDAKLTNPLPISGTVNSTVSGTIAVSNMIPAVETGLATAAKQDIAQVNLDGLTLTQGTTGTTAKGPLVQGLVSDSRSNLNDGVIAPISITTDGRLRVATSPSDSYIDFFVDSDIYGDADIFGIPVESPFTVSSFI